jgi:hypothetical protein
MLASLEMMAIELLCEGFEKMERRRIAVLAEADVKGDEAVDKVVWQAKWSGRQLKQKQE